jgi:hypothetical protein
MSLRNTQQGGVEIILSIQIIDGGVELIMTTGEWLDLTDIESIDGEIRWEIVYEIKDMVKELIDSVSDEYGFGAYLDDIEINL